MFCFCENLESTFGFARLKSFYTKKNEMTYSAIVHLAGGRCGSLMVSAMDYRSGSPGDRVLAGALCCVLGQDNLLSWCISSQVYKWVPENLMQGVTL